MACKVVISRSAALDRDSIVSYLVEELGTPVAARRFLDAIDRMGSDLASAPEGFPPVLEPRVASAGYRKYQLGGYLAIYRYTQGIVRIARIVHQTQDWARLL